jgi:3-oxoacyl-[acyl-carrier-protein] synthase I
MNAKVIAIRSTGLVTSVGLDAPSSCAAIRAKLTNPSDTQFIPSGGEPIIAHQVNLDVPWRGVKKLAHMATMAIEECMVNIGRNEWSGIPLLLCVAENDRPGRLDGLDTELFMEIQTLLDTKFSADSSVVAGGRVSTGVALARARKLIYEKNYAQVLVVATDSLLTWPTLRSYVADDRILTSSNSNGFIPGEASAALLVTLPSGVAELQCVGMGFGVEKAHINSDDPLRGDGLTFAVKSAIADAECEMHDMDYRIADLSGEQYYFKEASLALNRVLRKRKEELEIWHPAESIGEVGATAGAASLAVMLMAAVKAYSPGQHSLLHLANDDGARVAIIGYGV